MSTILSDSPRRAAKRYRCYYCDQRIEVGDFHGHRTGVNEGDFWSMRFHPECDEYAQKNWDQDQWECHEPGEFARPMTAFDPCI